MKILTFLLLICYATSIRLMQANPEISINITVPFSPRNVTSSFPLSPSMNITPLTPEPRPSISPSPEGGLNPPLPENGLNTTPSMDMSNLPSNDIFPSTPGENIVRLPRRGLGENAVSASPIWANRTIQLGQPPVNPEGNWGWKYKVIPPQFWDQKHLDAILLTNNDGMALSCSPEGTVQLTKVSRDNSNQLWYPKIINWENLVRLRSHYGGYLYYDWNTNSFSCNLRDKNFLSRWDVFWQISETKRNQCIFLMNNGKFLGFDQSNLILDNWTGDYNRYCFFGMPTSLTSWANNQQYKLTFDPMVYFGRRT